MFPCSPPIRGTFTNRLLVSCTQKSVQYNTDHFYKQTLGLLYTTICTVQFLQTNSRSPVHNNLYRTIQFIFMNELLVSYTQQSGTVHFYEQTLGLLYTTICTIHFLKTNSWYPVHNYLYCTFLQTSSWSLVHNNLYCTFLQTNAWSPVHNNLYCTFLQTNS